MGNTMERLRHKQTTDLSRRQSVGNRMSAVRTVADYNEIDVEGHGLTLFDLEARLTPVCVLTLQPFPPLLWAVAWCGCRMLRTNTEKTFGVAQSVEQVPESVYSANLRLSTLLSWATRKEPTQIFMS
jgi:hypothetical protein